MEFCLRPLLLLLVGIVSAEATGQPLFWQLTDGPYGGQVNTLAVAPDGTLYAGTPWGLFRTKNGGMQWDSVATGFPHRFVHDVVTTPNGDLFALISTQGILRSADGGATWALFQEGLPPDSAVTVLAAGPNGDVYAGLHHPAGGLYRLRPGERMWENAGLPSPSAIAVAQRSDGMLLVSPAMEDNSCFSCITLYHSTDGTSWDEVVIDSVYSATVTAIIFHPDGTAFIGGFWWDYDIGDGLGVYRSGDGGATWEHLPETREAWIENLFVDTAGTVYAAGWLHFNGFRETMRSLDHGTTWQPVSFRVLALAENAAGSLYAGTERLGLRKSTDGGSTWDDASTGLGRALVSHVAISPDGTRYAAGTYLYRFDENGWRRLQPPDSWPLSTDALSVKADGTVFVASHRQVYRSRDAGATWQRVSPDITKATVRKLLVGPGNVLYAATNHGLYRSFNDGDTWTPLQASPVDIRDLAINADGHLFVGTGPTNVGVYRSLDDGATWTLVGSWGSRISAVGVSKAGTVFASSLEGGVHRSTDNGETWTQIDIGLIQSYGEVETFVVNEDGIVFAGTEDDVLVVRSDDDGLTWEPVRDGMEGMYVSSLVFDDVGFLYAAAGPYGLFRSVRSTRVATETPVEVPRRITLHQNYPNPFNPGTTIPFTLEQSTEVILEIFDVLGRQVATLLSRRLPAGAHTVAWEAEGLSGGVYIYRLRAGSFSAMRKLALLR